MSARSYMAIFVVHYDLGAAPGYVIYVLLFGPGTTLPMPLRPNSIGFLIKPSPPCA